MKCSRRTVFKASAALAALACSGEPMHGGQAPWSMWGSTKQILCTSTGASASLGQSNQIAFVDYHRPETWNFLLAVHVDDVAVAPAVVTRIEFELTTGVGRSQITIPRFGLFQIAVVDLVAGNQFQITSTELPSERASRVSPNVIERIVGQQISLQARCFFEGGATGPSVALSVSGFFAPQPHIRPDWYNKQFSQELEGK
jgi:hypothetical protein